MHGKAWLVCATWLVVASGCSDDGLNVQDLNSSSTGSGGSSTTIATGPQTTVDTQGATGSGEEGVMDSTGGDTGVGSSTSEVPTGTTGDVSTTGGSSGSTGGSSGGTTEGSSGTTGACEPITEDPSGIGGECVDDTGCLPGYTCQAFAGIVVQLSCQILCELDCECPMGLVCLETADKSGSTWHQCG